MQHTDDDNLELSQLTVLVFSLAMIAGMSIPAATGQSASQPWIATDRLTHVEATAASDSGAVNIDCSLWIHEDKLSPPGIEQDSEFGRDIALAGDTLAVGAPGLERVFVYEQGDTGWVRSAVLDAPRAGASFGYTVGLAADGNTLVVGAPFDGIGSVHVYERSDGDWDHRVELRPDDLESGDVLGFSLAISADGSTIVAGAIGRDTSAGAAAGSAFVWERTATGWQQAAELTASDGGTAEFFGFSVAVDADGQRVAVSAVRLKDTVYVFDRASGDWTQEAALTDGRGFGASIDLSASGNTLVVGDDREGTISVLASTENGWDLEAKLRPADANPFSGATLVGTAVTLSTDGDRIVVGAAGDDASPGTPFMGPDLGPSSAQEWSPDGAAYVFDQSADGWVQTSKLVPADGIPEDVLEAGDHFGLAVAIGGDGDDIVVGAPLSDVEPATSEVGAVYTYISLVQEVS